MATSVERLKIIKLVQDGKLTAEEGIELLDLLGAKAPAAKADPAEPQPGTAQWFRVLVTDIRTGKTRVNVRLPISLVNAGMKMGARFSPQVDGLDREKLAEFIKQGVTGKVVDVTDERDGEHVEVFIE
jgi:hypothetical protein